MPARKRAAAPIGTDLISFSHELKQVDHSSVLQSLTARGSVDVETERVRTLNSKPKFSAKAFVLYWMQASPRVDHNHALELAVQRANALDRPLLVCFGLTDNYPEANERHYAFMLEGLAEVQHDLAARQIQLVLFRESPELVATKLAAYACEVVVDMGYLRIQRLWREHLANHAPCLVTQVETEVVVPVETASNKEEWAARTLRPKINVQLRKFLRPLLPTAVKHSSVNLQIPTVAPVCDIATAAAVDALLAQLRIDHQVKRVAKFRGGWSQAKMWLSAFIATKLRSYDSERNKPELAIQSHLSPYLHFGQISPIYCILQAVAFAGAKSSAKEAFQEELIVRRELSMNFCWFNARSYDKYACLPEWALKTLNEHKDDPRQVIYSKSELEEGRTYDAYWNAAQLEMVVTGKMHNYMRMYWGKKVVEWTETPQRAFAELLYLNNKYELDGRDANSFAGVAWIFGKHDRAHAERNVTGKLRYMSSDGLRRKFDIDAYVTRVNALVAAAKRDGSWPFTKAAEAGPADHSPSSIEIKSNVKQEPTDTEVEVEAAELQPALQKAKAEGPRKRIKT
eukprot:TRINITY_DN6142_c0_g1_i1.p1 TRINITY_DN6142_c0_g1~~TRINITY_DN6142_c0_g1_i1.p1  ORF type:complete len:569 (+),score=128.84 TRINITY_DN6142_c0_g1_i1:60-1766(+)